MLRNTIHRAGFFLMCTTLLFAFPKTTAAQFGVELGSTFSSFTYSDDQINPNLGYEIDLRPYLGYDIEWVQLGEQKALISPFIGLHYNYQFAKRWNARPGLNFTQKGTSFNPYDYEKITYQVRISYLEMPLSIGYQFIQGEKFISEGYLGGFGAIKLNAIKKVAYHQSEAEKTKLNSVEHVEAGLHAGLSFMYQISDKYLRLNLRVFTGLSEVFFVPEDQIRLYYDMPGTKTAGMHMTLAYVF